MILIKSLKILLVFLIIHFLIPSILISFLDLGSKTVNTGHGGKAIFIIYNFVIILIHFIASIVALIVQNSNDIGNKLIRVVVVSNCLFNLWVFLYFDILHPLGSEYSVVGYIVMALYAIFSIYISLRLFRDDPDETIY